MGISESFLSLGWIVGPLVGGYAADVAGFAAPFILTGGLALLATPVLYFLMPASQPPHLRHHVWQQACPMSRALPALHVTDFHQRLLLKELTFVMYQCPYGCPASFHSLCFFE